MGTRTGGLLARAMTLPLPLLLLLLWRVGRRLHCRCRSSRSSSTAIRTLGATTGIATEGIDHEEETAVDIDIDCGRDLC